MSLVFDHTRERLSECMGMPDTQIEELHGKLASITTDYAMNGKRHKSKIVERIANELSYNELLFVSLGYIEAIMDRQKEDNSPLSGLRSIINKYKK